MAQPWWVIKAPWEPAGQAVGRAAFVYCRIIVSGKFLILLRRGVKSACEATLLFFVFLLFQNKHSRLLTFTFYLS